MVEVLPASENNTSTNFFPVIEHEIESGGGSGDGGGSLCTKEGRQLIRLVSLLISIWYNR